MATIRTLLKVKAYVGKTPTTCRMILMTLAYPHDLYSPKSKKRFNLSNYLELLNYS